MSKWSETNKIQSWIWTILLGDPLDQIKQIFDNSGTIKMQDLQYWSNLDSSAMRQIKATGIATTIDEELIGQFGTGYLNGVTSSQAIESMGEIIATADKTINDLTDTAETLYDPNILN